MQLLPTVDIVIASYNHDQYLQQAVESCLTQDYEGQIDIFVIDDASTDNTSQVLTELEHMAIGELRKLTVVRKPVNRGLRHSIELGLSLGTGAYLQILGSDDWLAPTKITVQVMALAETSADCVYSAGTQVWIDGEVRPMHYSLYKRSIERGRVNDLLQTQDWGIPLLQSALVSRHVLEETSTFRSLFVSDDWAIAIYLHRHTRVAYLDVATWYYRMHPQNAHANYWGTLYMRIQVVGGLVEPGLRLRAMSGVLVSMGIYSARAGVKAQAIKFTLAGLLLDPSLLAFRRMLLSRWLRLTSGSQLVRHSRVTSSKSNIYLA